MATAEKIDFILPPTLPESFSSESVQRILTMANLPADNLDDGLSDAVVFGQRMVTTASPMMVDQSSSDTTITPQKLQSWFEALIEMIEMFQSAEVSLSQNQSLKTGYKQKLGDAVVIQIKTSSEEAAQKIKEYEAEVHHAEIVNRWMKALGWVITALVFIGTCYFSGPGAAIVTLAVFVALQTSGLDEKIDALFPSTDPESPNSSNIAKRTAVKMVIAIALGLATGSLAGAVDSTIAAAVEVAAKTAASVAKSLAATGIPAILKQGVSAGVEVTLQTVFSLNVCADISATIVNSVNSVAKEKDKSSQETLNKVIVAMSAMMTFLMAFAGGMGGSTLLKNCQAMMKIGEALPKLTGKFASLIKCLSGALGSTKVYQATVTVFQLITVALGIAQGCAKLNQANTRKDQAMIEAMFQFFLALSDINGQSIQQSGQHDKATMKSMRACNDQWDELMRPIADAAQVLA